MLTSAIRSIAAAEPRAISGHEQPGAGVSGVAAEEAGVAYKPVTGLRAGAQGHRRCMRSPAGHGCWLLTDTTSPVRYEA